MEVNIENIFTTLEVDIVISIEAFIGIEEKFYNLKIQVDYSGVILVLVFIKE